MSVWKFSCSGKLGVTGRQAFIGVVPTKTSPFSTFTG
jgi:hypothetical protein